MTEEEQENLKIRRLPINLFEAVKEFEKDIYLQKVLGEHASRMYIQTKQAEWMNYTSQVTPWEIEEYLYRV